MPLEYSDRAIIGYAEFFRPFNEKTIFIEDENGETAYKRIINNLTGRNSVHKVFSLKGRDPVLADWRRNDGDMRYIYIIDGDLNLVFEPDNSARNLVALDRYSIENYLIETHAVREVISDYINSSQRVESLTADAERLIKECAEMFCGLFVLFAISHSKGLGLQTVSEGVMRYFTRSGFDRPGIFRRKKAILKELQSLLGADEVRALRRQMSNNIASKNLQDVHLVSGKHYLFPILHKFMEWNAGYSGRPSTLFNQLSRHCDFDVNSILGQKLVTALNG